MGCDPSPVVVSAFSCKGGQGLGRGFVISDHADWPALNRAIAATGAGRVFVTHGYTAPFARWLREQGLDADVVATGREAREGEGEGE